MDTGSQKDKANSMQHETENSNQLEEEEKERPI